MIPTEPCGTRVVPDAFVQVAEDRSVLTRRRLLVAAAGSVTLVGGFAANGSSRADHAARLPAVATGRHWEFINTNEAAFIDAAVDRLIPRDVLGPGALEAGVTAFIDRQLAGPYGRAADWYMQGPWVDGTPQQGYQRRRSPSEVYRAAILAIDDRTRRGMNTAFAELAPADQDEWLHALENGRVDLGDVSAKTFFTLLWQNTQEGFFADPIYLGNRGFAGWKLIGYPGPRYNYDGAIRHYGERYPLPTVGLMGRDPSRQPGAPL